MSYEHNCEACDYHTNTTSLFTRHCETIRHKKIQNGETEYRCNDAKCTYKTWMKCYYDQHMIRFHNAEGHVTRRFCCEKCHYETNVPSEYERHLNTDRHNIDGTKKEHICEVCNYKTNRAEHLKSHCETYTHKRNLEGKEKKIFNCEECRYSTNDKARYKEHLTSKKHQRLHRNN